MTYPRPAGPLVAVASVAILWILAATCRPVTPGSQKQSTSVDSSFLPIYATIDSVTPRATLIRDRLLTLVLTDNASMRSLDSLPGGREQVIKARLFEIPVEGNCVSEEHAVCGYHYFLGVVSPMEGQLGAFDLGWLGQISHLEWLPPDTADVDIGKLRLTVTNYPSWVFESEPSLRKVAKRFELLVSTDTMIVTEIP